MKRLKKDMHNLNKLKSWKNLINHYDDIKKISLNRLFNKDDRFNKYSINLKDMLVDYSKNHINSNTLSLFKSLLEEINIKEKIDDFFKGKNINISENKAVMHYLLRGTFKKSNEKIYKNDVVKLHNKMKNLSDEINSKKLLGFTGKKIKYIVNIGIGGSDLGPKMACRALKFYSNRKIKSFFISNVDQSNSSEVLRKINHDESIFIISSKSFKTIETIKNASVLKQWFLKKSDNKNALKKHFFAVTSNIEKAKSFGIEEKNIFSLWDWVGGRYSMWSAVGLPISIQIGFENFKNMLKGARDIDNHFLSEDFNDNIPMILACIGVWYNNFHKSETHAIFPYNDSLSLLPNYLQQADMESNGKSSTINNKKINYQTGPIIWGDKGTNGQHAFFQLIHQGTKKIPCDFIGFVNSLNNKNNTQEILLSNIIGQTKALMSGKKNNKIENNFQSKSFDGNKPSNTILFDKLTPYNLGRLIAIYEHKIFVQGCIWNINSFDQWGVELGKNLSTEVYDEINSDKISENIDSSTRGLIEYCKKTKS